MRYLRWRASGADSVAERLAMEDRFPDLCLRVRYADLVSEPERTAKEVIDFVGIAHVPGISASCFSAERRRLGPADHKILVYVKDHRRFDRSRMSGSGRPDRTTGLATMNELVARLGYLQADGE